jgi:hypothetical protein
MREVIPFDWCDVCHEEKGEKVAATVTGVAIVWGGKTRLVDLCAEHDRIFIDDGVRYLFKIGRAVENLSKPPSKSPGAKAELVDCLFPGCEDKVTKNALSSHSRNVHGVSLTSLRNGTAEINGQECPECKAEGIVKICLGPKGLGSHRFSAHGVVGIYSKQRGRPSRARLEALEAAARAQV